MEAGCFYYSLIYKTIELGQWFSYQRRVSSLLYLFFIGDSDAEFHAD